MVKNFRFEEPGVALSGFPASADEVDWLYDQGIRTVVSLHPVPEEAQARMRERGIRWEPVPVADWAEEVPARLGPVLQEVERLSQQEPAVLIHCQGGGGRAGTAYAAFLVARGVPVAEAIVRVPGVTREAQKGFLYGFAAGLAARRDETG